MAAPTRVAQYASASNGGTITVTVPNLQVGDLIIAVCMEAYSDTSWVPGGTIAGTWSQVGPYFGQTANFTNVRIGAFRKTVTSVASGTSGTVTLATTSESSLHVYHLRGASGVDGTPTIGGTPQNGSTRIVEVQPTNPATNDALLLVFYGTEQFTASAYTWTHPSGMTEGTDIQSANRSHCAGSAYLQLSASGSTGVKTATLTGTSTTYGEAYAAIAIAGPTVTAPTVSAGADATITTGDTFARTATENNNGAAITSRLWSVVSGPAQVGATIGTTAALSWPPPAAGAYTLRYAATNSAGTGADEVTITVNTPPRPPIVDAGPDGALVLGETFTRTATET